MNSKLKWQSAMKFEATAEGNSILMDAKSPIGHGSAQTPKELVVAGLGGCTAMDVVALLKKHRQNFTAFTVDVEVETTKTGAPTVFTRAVVTFDVSGAVDPAILNEAVHLSQTKYCGVSAMLSKAFPIQYRVLLNGDQIGEGSAQF